MDILEKTPTRLVIQSEPNDSRLLIGVLLLLICGLTFAVNLSTVFTCKRQNDGTGECALTSYWLITSTAQKFKLNEISAARVDTKPGAYHGRAITYYKLVLKVNSQTVPLATNTHPEQYQAADRINAFLADPSQQDLEIRPNADADLLPVGVIFAVTAMGLIGSGLLITTYIFDQSVGKFIIQKQWLLTTATPYPLDQVRNLELEVRPATRRQPEQKIVHIVFRSGLRIATSLPYELGLISTMRAYLKPIQPVVVPEREADKPTRPPAKPIRRVKYRRAKRINHD